MSKGTTMETLYLPLYSDHKWNLKDSSFVNIEWTWPFRINWFYTKSNHNIYYTFKLGPIANFYHLLQALSLKKVIIISIDFVSFIKNWLRGINIQSILEIKLIKVTEQRVRSIKFGEYL